MNSIAESLNIFKNLLSGGSNKKPRPVNPLKLNRKQNRRDFLNKLSGSFFIVIALMPLAGILLGVGAAIVSRLQTDGVPDTNGWFIFGDLLNQVGGVLFNNLGFFFAVAVVIGFTKDWKATISAVWAYFVFNAVQNAMLPTVLKDGFAQGGHGTYDFWFYHNISPDALASNVGITSFSTGVIGGLMVAALVIYCFKRWRNIKLPSFLSFFSGSRFVPFACTLYAVGLAFFTLLVWPAIATALYELGQVLLGLPTGVGPFIVTYIWRALTPIGIHHAFYTLFWFTPVGGQLDFNDWFIYNGTPMTIQQYADMNNIPTSSLNLTGDTGIWFALERLNLPFDTSFFNPNGDNTGPGTPIDLHPGQYIAPNFPFMIGGAFGSILAMIRTAPPKDRKKVAAIMGSALITSMAIGVTEPWLWSYILLAPFLFFGFHAIMAAIGSFIMVNLNVHVGTAFSCGLLDWVIYGVLPADLHTNYEWVIVLSVIYAPIYYFVFRYWMIWRKVTFPVIESGVTIGKKENIRAQSNVDLVAVNIVKGLGGQNNISSLFNCATRVRVSVKDLKKVNDKILLSTGAYKVLRLGTGIQIIYGPKAETIATKTNDYLKSLQKEGTT